MNPPASHRLTNLQLQTSSLALLLMLSLVTAVDADVVTVEVTIKSVDAKGRTISATRKGKTLELDVSRRAEVTINDKAGKLDALVVGQKATIHYEPDLEVITKIEATGEGATFKKLFDGETLNGWRGDERYWKVREGVIVGKNPDKSGEEFLSTKQTFENFVLRLKFRYITGNSGINFRSHAIRGDFLAGPQAEITDLRLANRHITHGVLFDNRGQRGIIADVDAKLKPRLLDSISKAEWSDYRITVDEDHITVEINGETINEIEDEQIAPSGVIGFQLHGSTGTHVEFKDIEILEHGTDE